MSSGHEMSHWTTATPGTGSMLPRSDPEAKQTRCEARPFQPSPCCKRPQTGKPTADSEFRGSVFSGHQGARSYERGSWPYYVRNKKLLGTSALLLVTSALLVVTRFATNGAPGRTTSNKRTLQGPYATVCGSIPHATSEKVCHQIVKI